MLQNSAHPWIANDLIIRVDCPGCGKLVDIDQAAAAHYYDRRIQGYFSDVHGEVLDLGCGDGFLTRFLAAKPGVTRIYAADPDGNCAEPIGAIAAGYPAVSFENLDAGRLGERFSPGSLDFVVHRDVFMFIPDPDRYFDDITRIVRRGIRHMGWYVTGNERMHNRLRPEEIVNELRRRGWKADMQGLDWYKCGYFIRADR